MPSLDSAMLALLILVVPTDYPRLSLPILERALHAESILHLGVLWQALLVTVMLGWGIYGGIVIPQFVIGAVLGGALAHLFGLEPALGAAVGLVSVAASVSSRPIAAILMGEELFGADATLYVAGACVAAYVIFGHRSVYPAQQIAFSKSSWIFACADLPVGQEKVRLSDGLLCCWSGRRRQGNDHK
jgi:H+/Cl- antiporter ClcA